MSKEKYFTSLKSPKIYAYTTPEYESRPWMRGTTEGRGYLKVGYTEQSDVHDRIRQQVSPVKGPEGTREYSLIYETAAIKEDGECFRDFAVHKALGELGVVRKDGEWFECTIEDIKDAILAIKLRRNVAAGRCQNFGPRPEQLAAVNVTAKYFREHSTELSGRPPKFLWNAKMRFGKTFTAYKLSDEMKWKRVLILTYKPAVQTAWKTDLLNHVDFEDWKFVGKGDEIPSNVDNNRYVCFVSFQDLLGTDKAGGVKEKFLSLYNTSWDCVVLDEYHFGSWRDSAKELYMDEDVNLEIIGDGTVEDVVLSRLKSSHYLYMSGTPFRALRDGEFTEDQIFNWTYSDEQRAKAMWDSATGENPYADLPQLVMMTYQMPEALREVAFEGELNEFDLNEFFRAKGKGKMAAFLHQEKVMQWLSLIRGQYDPSSLAALKDGIRPPLPYEDANLSSYLNHTLWLLPDVSSCDAMGNLLNVIKGFFGDYKVVVAAGNKAGMGADAQLPVNDAIGSNPMLTKTITLTCGKLTTGVSVPSWTGIFMLRNLTSPESYFQAAFRVQTPWIYRDKAIGKNVVVKEKCYVFDFAPSRALRLVADYNGSLDLDQNESSIDKIKSFLEFLPVLCFDGYKMLPLNASDLLDIVVSGTASSMLARRFQSSQLLNLDIKSLERLSADQSLLAALGNIEAFRALNSDLSFIISSEKSLKDKKDRGEEITKDDEKVRKEVEVKRSDIKELLLKFISRLPIFMYLSTKRELGLKDVIENLESSLFTKTTGLAISDFKKLCELNIFHSQNLNSAIFAFKSFEDGSLNYAKPHIALDPNENLGGWDTTLKRSEVAQVVDGLQ